MTSTEHRVTVTEVPRPARRAPAPAVAAARATLASRIAASPERVEQAREQLAAAMADADIARGARLVEEDIARGACPAEAIQAAVRIITLAYQAEHVIP